MSVLRSVCHVTIGRPCNYPCFRSSYSLDTVTKSVLDWRESYIVLFVFGRVFPRFFVTNELHMQITLHPQCESWRFVFNCHQKQVFFLKLLQDWRNLLVAWVMRLDAGGTFWTKHFASCGVVSTRADRCGYVLYSNVVSQSGGHGTNDISLASCVRSHEDAAFERMLAPIEGRQAIPWQDSEKVEPKWNNVS